MITFTRRLRDCSSGAALMEAAIVFPLVMILMIGIIEFGRAFQDYHVADNSMRSAARYFARVPEVATCPGEWGRTNAANLAVFGTINPGDAPPLVDGWEPSDITFTAIHRDPECAPPALDELLVFRIESVIPLEVQMLSAIGLPSTISIRVAHEERHIGG